MILAVSEAAFWAVPLASLIVSLATLVYALIAQARSADARRVDELEARIKLCEDDRTALREEVEGLKQVEYRLRRRIERLEEERGK